jgi:hypothetical protein
VASLFCSPAIHTLLPFPSARLSRVGREKELLRYRKRYAVVVAAHRPVSQFAGEDHILNSTKSITSERS